MGLYRGYDYDPRRDTFDANPPATKAQPKVKAPSEITIKWLIERDACKEGLLRFLDIFVVGRAPLDEINFYRMEHSDRTWLRQQIEGPMPWESQEYYKAKGLAKLTKEEKEALGV